MGEKGEGSGGKGGGNWEWGTPLSTPSLILRGGVKIKLFQNMVMLHIKLKRMTNAATCKYIFCLYTYSRVKRSKHSFLKLVMLHIK